MKKTLLKTLMMVALLVMSYVTYAVPADPKPITVKQPNGKTLTYYLKGDEKMSWAVTTDGYTLLTDSKGNMVYAVKDNKGNMVASNVFASNENERSSKEIKFLANVEKRICYSDTQKQGFEKLWASKVPVKYTQGHFPAKGGSKNLLVVLVNFSDLSFTTSKTVFENMCMQDNYNNSGSIHQYYYTTSGGELDLQIDVVGPVTLPNSMAYYGGHETKTYNGQSYEVKDKNTKAFVEHAVQQAASLVDFSDYDNDGDGIVDDIAFIFAGTPESSTNHPDEIWPHSSEAQLTTLYNGVKINRYTCSAEKPDQVIGTFCHEFGHALGLPDFYDTDYEQSGGTAETVGSWSLMCNGSYNNNQNTPPLWSAMEKSIVGWIDTVIQLGGTMDSLRIPAISGTNDTAYQVFLSGTEFLMIENRRKVGFDSYLPGEGMLIYHGQMNKINAWINYGNNQINVSPSDRGWYLEPADGIYNNVSKTATPFPGSKNVTYFISPKLVNGTTVDTVAMTEIHQVNDSVMMFSYNPSKPFIETGNATNKKAVSFTANGKVTYKNDSFVMAKKGFVYSLEEDCPYVEANTIEDTDLSDEENISAEITGLTNSTTYYYRAFVTDNDNNIYFGNIKNTKTTSGFGYATTKDATNIDSTSATLNASLESIGQGTFVEKGFVYILDNSDINPTIEDEANGCVKVVIDGDELGAYSYELTGLEMASHCYYRAFMTNSFGTYYDSKKSFQTLYPEIINNISSDQDICSGSAPEKLTGDQVSGGFGEYTYLWEQKSGYGSWNAATGVNNEEEYQPSALTATTMYRRTVTSAEKVSKISNEITINVMETKAGNLTTSKDVYQIGEEVKLTLKNFSGDIVEWYMGTSENDMTSVGNAGNNTYTQTFDQIGTRCFQVKVKASACEAKNTAIKTITIDNSSINDVDNTTMFDIMPNPSTDGVFTINSNITNAESIVITNALGQVVYQQKDVDLQNKTIELNNVENGSYIISIVANDKVTTKKIIINK